jgi:hypothetical protein
MPAAGPSKPVPSAPIRKGMLVGVRGTEEFGYVTATFVRTQRASVRFAGGLRLLDWAELEPRSLREGIADARAFAEGVER